jgi:hypothetical protein
VAIRGPGHPRFRAPGVRAPGSGGGRPVAERLWRTGPLNDVWAFTGDVTTGQWSLDGTIEVHPSSLSTQSSRPKTTSTPSVTACSRRWSTPRSSTSRSSSPQTAMALSFMTGPGAVSRWNPPSPSMPSRIPKCCGKRIASGRAYLQRSSRLFSKTTSTTAWARAPLLPAQRHQRLD